jgi:hypothetical protein
MAGAKGRAPDLGAGGTRVPTRLRGVGFFNAVLVRTGEGTFFDATLVFSADEVFFGGFFSSVAVGILGPSLVGR